MRELNYATYNKYLRIYEECMCVESSASVFISRHDDPVYSSRGRQKAKMKSSRGNFNFARTSILAAISHTEIQHYTPVTIIWVIRFEVWKKINITQIGEWYVGDGNMDVEVFAVTCRGIVCGRKWKKMAERGTEEERMGIQKGENFPNPLENNQPLTTFALLSKLCNSVKMIATKIFMRTIFVENFTQNIFCNITFS